MKRKIILSVVIIVLVCVWIFFLKNEKEVNNNVIVKNSKIVQGAQRWNEFKENALNGNSDSIHLLLEESERSYDNTLTFDGTYYQYTNAKEGKTSKYKYLLDLTGKRMGTIGMTHWVVLADKRYSLMDLTHSIESSNSADWIDFEIIFFN